MIKCEVYRGGASSARGFGLSSVLILVLLLDLIGLCPAPASSASSFQTNGGPDSVSDQDQQLRLFLEKRGLSYSALRGSLLEAAAAAAAATATATATAGGAAPPPTNTNSNYDNNPPPATFGNDDKEVYLLEDKDYPRSVFENYGGVIEQASGITALPSGDVAVFHRANREWTARTFQPNNSLTEAPVKAQDNLITNDTIMILDGESGGSKLSFGANLFYMPHGIASDSRGNLWVTDVGRHQVMRLPTSMINMSHLSVAANSSGAREQQQQQQQQQQQWLPGHLSRLWPDIILGEAFVPGADEAHFCEPAEVAVSSDDRLVYVADGYCNRRIVVLTGEGKYLASFGEEQNMDIVHSVTLIEERNLICAADREGRRILCFKAGLDGDLSSLGELVLRLDYPIGRVFAIAAIDPDHLVVSGSQPGNRRFDLAALNPFRSTIKQIWTSSDLLNPHSLAATRDGQFIYAAELSREAHKKVFKFRVIREKS